MSYQHALSLASEGEDIAGLWCNLGGAYVNRGSGNLHVQLCMGIPIFFVICAMNLCKIVWGAHVLLIAFV